MRIKYALEAIHDLERLRVFVEFKNLHAARRIAAELLDGIGNLASFPELGLPVRRAPDPNVIRDLFVVMALYGGGTRATALDYGVFEYLGRVRFGDDQRSLLDEADAISSS